MNNMRRTAAICLAAICLLSFGSSALAAPARNVSTSTAASSSSEKAEKRTGNGKGMRVNVISVAASVLGKTEEEVRESVKSGKVGDLLIAANKVQAFKTAYLTEAKSKLDAAATAGAITRTEADEKYAEAQAKMAAYDGTTHLCGQTDHSKLFEKSRNTTNGNATESA